MKKRLYSIDIFRIACAIFVFLFHSRGHLGINYFIFNSFIDLSHIFMVAFFMLSGFSLYYVDWSNKRLDNEIDRNQISVGNFILKRVLGIYPLYIATYLLFILIFVVIFSFFKNNNYINDYISQNIGNYSLLRNIVILPVELTMLQSVFNGSSSVLNNGGTWFISCIFICYLLYPYAYKVIIQNKKSRKYLLALFYLISSYAFLVKWMFKFGSIYENPFFRFLEFLIGVIIASFCMDDVNKHIRRRNVFIVLLSFLMLICVITIGVHCFGMYEVGAYNFIAIPIFGLVLYILARIEYNYPIMKFNKFVLVCSENTYAFFLAQFFTWQPIKIIDNNSVFFANNRNIKLFFCSLVICLSITFFLHYGIEKPIKKLLYKKFIKK